MSDDDELDYLLEEEDEFHTGEQLSPPEANAMTTEKLYHMIHEGLIDLNPPYQRDVVWTVEKQMKLLDSMYKNIYMPPVLFSVYTDRDGTEVRRCVDGKQRLSSITGFFDGQIPYKDPATKKLFWFLKHETRTTKKEVPEKFKTEFRSKTVMCVEYRDLTSLQEHDIFQRVQMGMPLTVAERLQAISSRRNHWIHDLDQRFFFAKTGIPSVMDVSIKRGNNFQMLAQLVFYCDGIPHQKVSSAAKLEVWLSDSTLFEESFKKKINSVMRKFWLLANEPHLRAAFSEIADRVAPVEFVFIGVLLYVLIEVEDEEPNEYESKAQQKEAKERLDRHNQNLADEIYGLRVAVRKAFPNDVRHRTDVVKSLWEFIIKRSKAYERGIEWAVETGKGGRKRNVVDEDEDDYSRRPRKKKA